MGLIGQIINLILLSFQISAELSLAYTSLIVIFVTCLFTGLGFFDNLVSKYQCGLIIPTTGFAHSIMSSSLDYKKDGFVTKLKCTDSVFAA